MPNFAAVSLSHLKRTKVKRLHFANASLAQLARARDL